MSASYSSWTNLPIVHEKTDRITFSDTLETRYGGSAVEYDDDHVHEASEESPSELLPAQKSSLIVAGITIVALIGIIMSVGFHY